jgi:monofunctional biosynthetic peptidoglycan transglycosylase
MIHLLIIVAAITSQGDFPAQDTPLKTIFDFTSVSTGKVWNIINDGVMGGLSRSRFEITPDNTAVFSGQVSLENNGGFASVRTVPRDYRLDGYTGIFLRVKGDGNIYSFRVRTDARFDGISYRAKFFTEKDQWIEIRLPFEDFVPTYHGRILSNRPPVDPEKIQQMGFLIADKQKGPFKLIIDWIKAYP